MAWQQRKMGSGPPEALSVKGFLKVLWTIAVDFPFVQVFSIGKEPALCNPYVALKKLRVQDSMIDPGYIGAVKKIILGCHDDNLRGTIIISTIVNSIKLAYRRQRKIQLSNHYA